MPLDEDETTLPLRNLSKNQSLFWVLIRLLLCWVRAGWGEVYRAHNTRLNREVAIKVLPDALAASPDDPLSLDFNETVL